MPHEGEQNRGAETVDLAQLLVGERVGDRDERAAGVLLTDLGWGEIETSERPELRVGEHLDGPALLVVRDAHEGKRKALGVDQLDLPGLSRSGLHLVGQSDG